MEEGNQIIQNSADKKPLWDVVFTLIGILLSLTGIIFLLLSALFEEIHLLNAVFRDIGLALFPIGAISLVIDWLLKKYYVSTIENIVRKEHISTVEIVMDRLIKEADLEAFRKIEKAKKLGLYDLLTRAELEVSNISFKNVVQNLLKDEKNDKEFFILGKTLEFISKQTGLILQGLEQGIHFKFSLIDPTVRLWDTENIRSLKEKSKVSTEKIREILKNANPRWSGTLEIRKTMDLVENSFSSFVSNGKRISVLDFDLGEEQSKQFSQEYIHKVNEVNNFAAHLYSRNKDYYKKAQFVLSYPLYYEYVYIYGIKDKEIALVNKKNKNVWELPGGTIEPGEIPEETAKREFLEETGYNIHILDSTDTIERNKLAFIGKVGDKYGDPDKKEIEHLEFIRIDKFPENKSLAYPHTGYEKILKKILSKKWPGI